jgi:hypothetical protein
MIIDVKKLDDKLSEYVVPIFGVFVISNGIGIHEKINRMKFKNNMIVVNFSNKFKEQIDILGNNFLSKTRKLKWFNELNDNNRVELELAYRNLESVVDNNHLEIYTDLFFYNMKKILFYIRNAYNINSLNDICNEIDMLKIV